jgi:GNAT superfamily N-acetyltransferase
MVSGFFVFERTTHNARQSSSFSSSSSSSKPGKFEIEDENEDEPKKLMNTYEVREGDVLISDDPALLDRPLIHRFLSERSYWAQGVPREVVERSIDHSLCFGVHRAGRQVGFARVVTDFATFAWLADVFVLEEHRGHGLSKRLVAAVIAHPRLQGLRRFLLGTLDAHGLYAQFGFKPIKEVERFMEIHEPNPYKQTATPPG